MRNRSTYILGAALLAALLPLKANAALFADNEARHAILDVRTKLDTKADKSSLLDLAAQNEMLRQEVARLRGQVELLSNELANEQKRNKDFYVELDNRLRKIEPQSKVVDGKEVAIDQAEQKAFDVAMTRFKEGQYKQAGWSFSDFLNRYPDSAYAASAHYWLGNAFFAQRSCKKAIKEHGVVVEKYAESQFAPDAMLNIATCHIQLKQKTSAKKTLKKLVESYPESEAAKAASERLAKLK